jgi:hypothetical protein
LAKELKGQEAVPVPPAVPTLSLGDVTKKFEEKLASMK